MLLCGPDTEEGDGVGEEVDLAPLLRGLKQVGRCGDAEEDGEHLSVPGPDGGADGANQGRVGQGEGEKGCMSRSLTATGSEGGRHRVRLPAETLAGVEH